MNNNNLLIPDQGVDCRGIKYKRTTLSPRMQDHTGKIHGRLLPLFPILRPNTNKKEWLCKCQCGKLKIVSSANLHTGKITSCGCLRSETTSKHIIAVNHTRFEDFSGQIINNMQVLEVDQEMTILHSFNSKHYYWKCQCLICKKITSLRSDTLREIKRVYCHFCDNRKSIGEHIIKNLLIKYDIPFTQQQIFPTCIFPDTKNHARFDFYVNNNYLIEYDGRQHFETRTSFFPNLKTIQEHDYIKNLWCYQNNIPLIRIPYTHIDNIRIEDLLLETTKYKLEYDNGKFINKSKATSLYC